MAVVFPRNRNKTMNPKQHKEIQDTLSQLARLSGKLHAQLESLPIWESEPLREQIEQLKGFLDSAVNAIGSKG